MRNRVINILVSSVAIFLFSCSSPISKTDSLIHEVTIRKAITNKEEVVLSDFVKGEIKYVQLESKPECLLGRGLRFYLNDTFIIAIAENQIFLFDRETGKFIREIGHQGKDPEGYRKTVFSFPYNESSNTFIARGWAAFEYNEYDVKGRLCKRYIAEHENLIINSIAELNDSSFVGYVWNYDGEHKTKLVVFNNNNEVIKTYPQLLSFEFDLNVHGLYVLRWEGWFYKYQDCLNFYERSTDTIFQITGEELTPRYVLKNGDYGTFYEKRNDPRYEKEDHNYYGIYNLFESENYLFIFLRFQANEYYGLYDKETRTTSITQNKYGIKNDIDDFIPFYFYSVNNQDEIIGFQEAYMVQEWFEENKEQADNLPEELKKFKQIKESDNPVVLIAKLKE